jgi:imidazolonepropionase-like amidohydrolase
MHKNNLVLKDAKIFSEDGQLQEGISIAVKGDKIAALNDNGKQPPPDAEIMSFKGCTILPGLIDCHTHITLDASGDPFGQANRDSMPILAWKAAKHAKDTLLAGVTTIRDMGGVNDLDLELRDAINSGLLPGPRIIASGKVICMTGGHGWSIGREADGPDQVRQAVREQIKKGADIIKFMVTGGVLTPGSNPGALQMTYQELAAGIEEAHKAGRKTSAHAKGTEGIVNALKAGIDSIEHGTILNEEAVELLIKNQVSLNLTLSATYGITQIGPKLGASPSLVEKTLSSKKTRQKSIALIKKYPDVIITSGTDAGTPYNRHGANPKELELLCQEGFSPKTALLAATSQAAESLGLAKQIGSIVEGGYADLLVIDGDPLKDIGLLQKKTSFRLILKGGQVVYRDDGLSGS